MVLIYGLLFAKLRNLIHISKSKITKLLDASLRRAAKRASIVRKHHMDKSQTSRVLLSNYTCVVYKHHMLRWQTQRAAFFHTPKTNSQRQFLRLPQYHIEHHHQHKANGKPDGTEVGMLAAGGFGDEFLDNNIEHGTCCEGQHVGQNGRQQRG